jgi:hypothetical protein
MMFFVFDRFYFYSIWKNLSWTYVETLTSAQIPCFDSEFGHGRNGENGKKFDVSSKYDSDDLVEYAFQ